jgi:hypothetical protein
MFKTTCASIALVALTNPALAAGSCATSADVAALKTAVINQELMVAAFQCHEVSAYNRFVTTYKRELQSSDAVLKAYFVRSKHGEAGYDSFKTKAANLSALEQARHSDAFCTDAHALYAALFAHQGSLMSFVEFRPTDIGSICVESRPAVLASAGTRAKNAPVPVTARAEVADIGVPAHSLPALSYRRVIAAAPAPEDLQDSDNPSYAYNREYEARGYNGYPPRTNGSPRSAPRDR